MGALVADAATMGLHWIYSMSDIQRLLAGAGRPHEPAFFEPPSCPYYKYDSGALSPYGDEMLPVLQYMAEGPGAEAGGALDGPAFAKFLAAYYAAYRGRLNKSSRAMMEAVLRGGAAWPECGDPRDTQANSFVKVIPLVARYAGRPGLTAAVDAAVRAQQNNEEAVGYGMAAAAVLERVVLGTHNISAAIAWAAAGPAAGLGAPLLPPAATAALRAVLAAARAPLRDLVWAAGAGAGSKAGPWGASCANPGALQAALLGAMQAFEEAAGEAAEKGAGGGSGIAEGKEGGAEGGGGAYAAGVSRNALLGGDNCSRGVLMGALLAAQAGSGAIPPAWVAKTHTYGSAEALAERLLGFRGQDS